MALNNLQPTPDSENPFASVLAAARKTQQTQKQERFTPSRQRPSRNLSQEFAHFFRDVPPQA